MVRAVPGMESALEVRGGSVVSAAVDPRGGVVLEDLRNPYLVYLGGLDGDESARTMRGCLDRIVVLQAGGQGIAAAALGPDPGRYFPWHQLRYEHTAALRVTLAAQTTIDRRGRTSSWAPAYVNKHLAALRGVLQVAWRLGLMSTDDYHRAADVRGVKGSRKPAGRDVAQAEFTALLQACLADERPIGVRDAAILALMWTSGLRRAGITAARREDYDAAARTPALSVVVKGNTELTVPVHPTAVLYLERWLALTGHEHGPMFVPLGRGTSLPAGLRRALDDGTAAHLSPASVNRILIRRAQDAELPDLPGRRRATPHDIRRTIIGDLLSAGVDLATVAQVVGHANVGTTARYDRRDDTVRAAAIAQVHLPTPGQAVSAPQEPAAQ